MGPSILGRFGEFLGLEIKAADGDQVLATWSAEPRMHQPYGILHGGVHCSVVEQLASMGAGLWFADRGKVVGVSNSTDFFKAVSKGLLTSSARPLHRGRSQQVWVVVTEDEAGRLVARGQVRLQNLAADPAS